MTEHPSAVELESFLRGAASQETARVVVRHLLAACSSCRAVLDSMSWQKERLERLVSLTSFDPEDLPATEGEGYEYDASFDRAWRSCVDELALPASRAADLLLEHRSEGTLDLGDLAAGVEDLVPEPRLINQLLDRSYAARYQDPAVMLQSARMARTLAERCNSVAAGGAMPLADLKSRAWGHVGNALRVAGRLREAERALSTAERFAEKGTGDTSLKIELLGWRASLYIFQRQFGDAVKLLEEAEGLCQETGNQAILAESLICKAIAWVYSGDPEKAIWTLNKAILLVDPADQRLLFTAHHNLITCYLEAGRLQEALALVAQARSLGEQIRDELLNLRLIWQEGRILNELGLLEEAEAQFSRARDGFLERDLSYEGAVVSLDLTAVYVKLGLHAEVRRTIGDILPIFSSLRVGRELLASLIQLQQAEDQTQALQLIRALSRELVAGPKLPPSV